MVCESCHQITEEILRLQRKISSLIKKLDDCECSEYEEEADDKQTCEQCLYFSPMIDHCWKRNIYRHRNDYRCRRFEDYEEWLKVHGAEVLNVNERNGF